MSEIEIMKKELDKIKAGVEQLYQKIESFKAVSTLGDESASVGGLRVEDMPEDRVAELFSPLAHVERVKILKRLLDGGKYFTELMNETGLSHSPLYFHLNVLQKGGYVNHEYVRGRYLITSLGSEALRAAIRLYRLVGEKG